MVKKELLIQTIYIFICLYLWEGWGKRKEMQGEKGRKKAGKTKSPTDNIYLGKQTHEKVNGIFFFFKWDDLYVSYYRFFLKVDFKMWNKEADNDQGKLKF